MPSLRLVQFTCCLLLVVEYCHGRSNGSAEHVIRKALLDNYDKNVLPERGHVLVVEFGLKLNKLIKVDNKEQLVKIDSWIVMKWNNTFLTWNKADYGGKDKVHFLPTEIWFPDIALYNNGDSEVVRAGGTDTFLSNVLVKSSGTCIWSGPATFTASCDMKLRTYPFDHQQCDFRFGSFSYASNQLKIVAFKTKKSTGDRFLASGNWDLANIKATTGETDHGNCCPYKFSEVVYSIRMTRRFQYHMFYLVAPCIVLTILTLVSFYIPTESGERIGFVTTLLLGMMVFLLLIPESLPESSKAIPTLGILMMATMAMIGLALLVTIMIIAIFYSKKTPLRCIRKLFGPKSHDQDPDPGSYEVQDKGVSSHINLRAVSPFQNENVKSLKLNAAEEDNEATWQNFARVFDRIMFWIFLIGTVIMYAVILTIRD